MCDQESRAKGASTRQGRAAVGGGEVARLLAMSENDKLELGKAVLEAAMQKENSLRAAVGTEADYGKSFGGTKHDTQERAV